MMAYADKDKQAAYMRQWRAKNRQRAREIQDKARHKFEKENPELNKAQRVKATKKWRKNNLIEFALSRAKSRAKRRGYEFSITKGDLPDIPEVCPLLGIPLDLDPTTCRTDGSLSIDRIDSSKGYIPGNVWFTSFKGNVLKSNKSLNEFNME